MLLFRDERSLRRLVLELARNRAAAADNPIIALPDESSAGWIHDLWRSSAHAPARIVSLSECSVPGADLAIVDVSVKNVVRCREAILLPDVAGHFVVADWRSLHVDIGRGPRVAVVVPGTTFPGETGVATIAIERLRIAEELAARRNAVVILSGWSPNGGLPEAEQLRRLWRGVGASTLLTDTAARTTAENVVFTHSILQHISSVRRVTYVISWSNALRQHLLIRRAVTESAASTKLRILWGAGHARTLKPGLFGLLKMEEHVKAAFALLDGGIHAPDARLE